MKKQRHRARRKVTPLVRKRLVGLPNKELCGKSASPKK